ncbi:MAG: DUF4345 family protein [Parcubacteria group bacterium]
MSTPDLAVVLAVIACVIGGALGGFAIARPEDVVEMVGLKLDPEKPHSIAEVRATYGGLFLLSHAATAAALGYAPSVGAGMALALAFGWLGAAVARGYSMVKEDAPTPFNTGALIFEMLMGLTFALPFWTLTSPGALGGGAVVV